MSEIPGPDVEVIERAPAHPAPNAIPSAAISSSACTTANVAFPVSLSIRCFLRYSMRLSHKDDDGVMEGPEFGGISVPENRRHQVS